MANSFARPVVVWIGDADRARLMVIAQRTAVPSERIGGHLPTRALLAYAPDDLRKQEAPGKTGQRYSLPTAPMGRARARNRQG